MVNDKNDFLRKLRSLLHYHRDIGLEDYPLSKDVDSFCKRQILSRPVPGHTEEREASAAVEKGTNKIMTLSEIREEVAACKACDLSKERIYPVAGRGKEGVRLLIVGDWLSVAGHDFPKDQILGVEQDQMLSKMLAAIKVLQEEVFITNVVKCAVPDSCHPTAAHVHCCMTFLRRQITILAPEVICTMGMIAAKAVLDRPHSLSQLRGKLHTYETEDGLCIPVVTTYHPTYLLQNPEMKKATWADLQFLAKKL